MHQIHVSDELYREAQRRAGESGFASVDEYVAYVLQHAVEFVENFDHLFTAERLAHIDRAAAQIRAGEGLTLEQADAELAKRRDEWLRQQAG